MTHTHTHARHGDGRDQGRGGIPCGVEPDRRAQRKLSQCRRPTDKLAAWDAARHPDGQGDRKDDRRTQELAIIGRRVVGEHVSAALLLTKCLL